MKIEHVAIYVNDLETMKEFYIKYFNATSNDGYHNPTTGLRTYFLTFTDGARLEIMHRPLLQDQEKTLLRTGFIHLAFSVGSLDTVDTLTNTLKTDGYTIVSEPRTTGDGYYESVVMDPEGNLLEITI